MEFRKKFLDKIKLRELQVFAKDGGILANMQTLRMTRLSVSKVTKKEWNFIMSLADDVEDTAVAGASNAEASLAGASNANVPRPLLPMFEGETAAYEAFYDALMWLKAFENKLMEFGGEFSEQGAGGS